MIQPAYSLLKRDHLYFVIKRDRYGEGGETEVDFQHSAEYFFKEHSCPTNWIGNTVLISENGDLDPHGFLEFVREVSVEEYFDGDVEDEKLVELFPELKEE